MNDELAQSEVKLEARTKELNAKHDAELSATIHLVEQTTRAPLEGELAAMRLQIQTATTAEREAITKVAALSDELCQMQKNEAELIKRSVKFERFLVCTEMLKSDRFCIQSQEKC